VIELQTMAEQDESEPRRRTRRLASR